MSVTGHAIVAATIITKVPDLRLAVPLILVSHVLGDLPNHWDTAENWRHKQMSVVFRDTVIDLFLSFTLVALVFVLWLGQNPTRMLIALVTSQILDYLEMPYFMLRWHFHPWDWINTFNHLYHKKLPQINLTPVWQIVISGAFILWAAL